MACLSVTIVCVMCMGICVTVFRVLIAACKCTLRIVKKVWASGMMVRAKGRG